MGAVPSAMREDATEAEGEGAPDRELYALLNVPPTASADDIRRAYRSLAQISHPDKHMHPQMKEIATENFRKIHEAYNVLIDDEKRRIYDVYGMEGLKCQMELGPHLNKREEIKEELEKLRRQRQQEKVLAQSAVASVTISPCLSLPHYLNGGDFMRRMEMSSEVQSQISKRDIVGIGGNMAVVGNSGTSAARIFSRHQLSPVTSVDFMATTGPRSIGVLQISRQISQHSTATSGLAVFLGDGSVNLSNTWTRRLSETSLGHINLVLGQDSALSVGWKKKDEKNSAAGELKFGAGSFGASAHYTHNFSPKSHGRVAGRIGSTALEFEIGGGRRISDSSSVRAHYVIGIQGVSWRFELLRGAHKLVVPVSLSKELNSTVITSALMIPSSLYFLLQKFVVEPLIHRHQQHKAHEKLEESLLEVLKARETAKKQQKLLENVASRNKMNESEKGGLVVTKALYGNMGHINEVDENSNLNDVASQVLDVTTPLNFLIADSKLELPKGIKKAGIMGFCDPCPGTPKKLQVEYTFMGQQYKVVVDDYDILQIPQSTHRV